MDLEGDVDQLISSTIRRLISVSATLCIIAFVIGALGYWSKLVGTRSQDVDSNQAVALFLICFAFTLPLAVWPRVLLGLHRNDLVLVIGIVGPVVSFSLGILTLANDLPIQILIVSPMLGAMAANVVAMLCVSRVAIISTSRTFLRALRRSDQRLPFWGIAFPMLVINIAQPLALSSDRIVLAHIRGLAPVAQYSVIFQIYSPCLAILAASGASIWPRFSASMDSARPTLRRDVTLVTCFAALMGIALVCGGGYAARLVGGRHIEVPLSLVMSFAALLVVQGATIPLAMSLMQSHHLRFQAGLLVLMLPFNLGASIAMAHLFVAGPVVASGISILLCQLVPLALRARSVQSKALACAE